MGCSDCASTAAMIGNTSARAHPSAKVNVVNSGAPAVNVPVLSSAITLVSCRPCSASPLRNNTPISAARPVPTIIDVGVANPIAQGQAIIRTDTPDTSANPKAGSGPKTNHVNTVTTVNPMTIGTNTLVIRSTSDWIGSLVPWASSTMRMIWDNTISAPTAVAR